MLISIPLAGWSALMMMMMMVCVNVCAACSSWHTSRMFLSDERSDVAACSNMLAIKL